MGDCIIASAIIRELAKSYDLVVVPAKWANLHSVSYLFHDLLNVVVRPVESHDEMRLLSHGQYGNPPVWKGKLLCLGQDGHNFVGSKFDQCFYEQAGMDFDLRWSGFKLVREPAQEVPQAEPCIFVHEDKRFAIDGGLIAPAGLPVVKPDPAMNPNLFAWIPTILAAKQCHVINSSFALLIDSLPADWWPELPKLSLHLYSRPGGEFPTFRKNWEILT